MTKCSFLFKPITIFFFFNCEIVDIRTYKTTQCDNQPCPQFKRCHQGPVRTWNLNKMEKWDSEYPGSSFFFFLFFFLSLFPILHKCISQSPFENLQLVFCHVWRGMSLKADKQTGLSLTWIPKVSPPPSDVKIWADLCSPRWSDPFISFF